MLPLLKILQNCFLGDCFLIGAPCRSYLKVKVMSKLRSQGKNVAKVIGATLREGFAVYFRHGPSLTRSCICPLLPGPHTRRILFSSSRFFNTHLSEHVDGGLSKKKITEWMDVR